MDSIVDQLMEKQKQHDRVIGADLLAFEQKTFELIRKQQKSVDQILGSKVRDFERRTFEAIQKQQRVLGSNLHAFERKTFEALRKQQEMFEKSIGVLERKYLIEPVVPISDSCIPNAIRELFEGEAPQSSFELLDLSNTAISLAESSYNAGDISKAIFEAIVSFVKRTYESLLINLLACYIFFIWTQPHSPPDNFRQANIQVNGECQLELIPSIRIVYQDAHTYSRNRGTSEIVDFLFSGEIVEILEQKKKWRLVRWADFEGDFHEGWVRAKNLRKPKPLSTHFLRKQNTLKTD